MTFWIKLKNIITVNHALFTVWFIKDIEKLERRLRFLETSCPDEVKASQEYWAITYLYKKRIKQLKSKNSNPK